MENKETIYLVCSTSDDNCGCIPVCYCDTREEAYDWIDSNDRVRPEYEAWFERQTQQRNYLTLTVARELLNSEDYQRFLLLSNPCSRDTCQLSRKEWKEWKLKYSPVLDKVDTALKQWEEENPSPNYSYGTFYVQELTKYKK